jgi:hypothetical protein
MDRRVARVLVVSLVAVLSIAPVAEAQSTKEDAAMSEEIASELKRLRQNQAALMAAINQLIAETAPIELANPADGSSGFVTNGLTLNADGAIVPGRIVAPAPQSTLRGVRSGDPLWVDLPGSP